MFIGTYECVRLKHQNEKRLRHTVSIAQPLRSQRRGTEMISRRGSSTRQGDASKETAAREEQTFEK